MLGNKKGSDYFIVIYQPSAVVKGRALAYPKIWSSGLSVVIMTGLRKCIKMYFLSDELIALSLYCSFALSLHV